MSREFMHVADALRLQRGRRGPADAAADINVNARGLSLERAEHQLVAAKHVDAQPVHVLESVVQQRNEIGSVRQRVRFVAQQGYGLRVQQLVICHGVSRPWSVVFVVERKCQNVADVRRTGCEHQEALEAHCDTRTFREAGL